jgi:hypothetical protein
MQLRRKTWRLDNTIQRHERNNEEGEANKIITSITMNEILVCWFCVYTYRLDRTVVVWWCWRNEFAVPIVK